MLTLSSTPSLELLHEIADALIAVNNHTWHKSQHLANFVIQFKKEDVFYLLLESDIYWNKVHRESMLGLVAIEQTTLHLIEFYQDELIIAMFQNPDKFLAGNYKADGRPDPGLIVFLFESSKFLRCRFREFLVSDDLVFSSNALLNQAVQNVTIFRWATKFFHEEFDASVFEKHLLSNETRCFNYLKNPVDFGLGVEYAIYQFLAHKQKIRYIYIHQLLADDNNLKSIHSLSDLNEVMNLYPERATEIKDRFLNNDALFMHLLSLKDGYLSNAYHNLIELFHEHKQQVVAKYLNLLVSRDEPFMVPTVLSSLRSVAKNEAFPRDNIIEKILANDAIFIYLLQARRPYFEAQLVEITNLFPEHKAAINEKFAKVLTLNEGNFYALLHNCSDSYPHEGLKQIYQSYPQYQGLLSECLLSSEIFARIFQNFSHLAIALSFIPEDKALPLKQKYIELLLSPKTDFTDHIKDFYQLKQCIALYPEYKNLLWEKLLTNYSIFTEIFRTGTVCLGDNTEPKGLHLHVAIYHAIPKISIENSWLGKKIPQENWIEGIERLTQVQSSIEKQVKQGKIGCNEIKLLYNFVKSAGSNHNDDEYNKAFYDKMAELCNYLKPVAKPKLAQFCAKSLSAVLTPETPVSVNARAENNTASARNFGK